MTDPTDASAREDRADSPQTDPSAEATPAHSETTGAAAPPDRPSGDDAQASDAPNDAADNGGTNDPDDTCDDRDQRSPETGRDAPDHRKGSKGGKGQGRGSSEPNGQTLVCRYGQMRYIGEFRHNLDAPPSPGQHAVVRTDRGVEMGEVLSAVDRKGGSCCPPKVLTGEKLQTFLDQAGSEFPFRRTGRVLRVANQQDLNEYHHMQGSAGEAGQYCREQIRKRNLPMKLVTVEHLLGGERIVFYFTAETRVDFRELVRDLASQFRTRIEMRQVGARDEARLVGDYERCGQRCCCQEFLKDLKPVSMRMAKVQKATLDPTKISGRCGRLMCCLRYEDDAYNELRNNLPRRNTFVRAGEVVGRVIETQIITQLVKLALPDKTLAVVRVDEITERNVEPPAEKSAPSSHRDVRPDSRREASRPQGGKSDDSQGGDESSSTASDGNNDRRGQGRSGESGGASGRQTGDGDQPKKKKRRRRRRKKKPSSGQG
jgi:cell fate regulator YaaT (PSP1 superfamily)